MTIQSLRNARIAFTGRLGAITPRQAAEIVASAGARFSNNISRLTSFLVIGMRGWPLLADGSVSAKLRRAEELNARGCRIDIISELRFLELANLRPAQPEQWKAYSAEEVCAALNVNPDMLRHWERFGLIRASEGRYDFQDLVSLQALAEMVQRGVKIEAIAASLHHLAARIPGTDRPLAQLKIVAAHSDVLADFGKYRLAPSGQLCFNFDAASECVSPVISLESGETAATDWFEAGQAYEEEEQYEQAAEAYRRATALDPHYAVAFFNLGNVLRSIGQSDEAQEMYRHAIGLDAAMASAWYNLADLQEELGQTDGAVASLRAAVTIAPMYADAHFNLASCLEGMGKQCEALPHWKAYLEIDPDSSWAEIAKRHIASAHLTR
jgi:tetratricopeptide (TPR) repeat protein